MPIIINILITAGVLWALLIIFNESGSLKYVQQEAFLIIGLVSLAGLLVAIFVPSPLGLAAAVVQVLVLIYCVEKIAQMSRSRSLRVAGWYFAVLFVIGVGFELLPG